jgi:hypothetical protein
MAKDVILLADDDEQVFVALDEEIRVALERLRSDRTLLPGQIDIELGNVRKLQSGENVLSIPRMGEDIHLPRTRALHKLASVACWGCGQLI